MITIAETQDTQACFALRHTVFVIEQGYSAEGEIDALDKKVAMCWLLTKAHPWPPRVST